MDVITAVLLLSGITFCTCEISLNNLEDTSEISFIKDQFEDICYRNGGKKALDTFKLEKMVLEECLERNLNTNTFIATNQSSFVKFCEKVPNLKSCIANFVNATKQCLDTESNKNVYVIIDVISGLNDYACADNNYENSEESIRCFESRHTNLNNCLNIIADGNLGIVPWMFILTNKQQCRKLDEFQSCVMNEIKFCKDEAVAATIAKSFYYVKPYTLCESNFNVAESKNRLKRQSKNTGFDDDVIDKFFSRRCLDKRLGVFDQASFNNLQMAVREVTTTLEDSYQMLHINPKQFCVVNKEMLQKSTKKLGKAMESCFLKDGEDYLAKFIPKSTKEITKFLCDDKGKNIYKLFSENGRVCLHAIANENGTYMQELQNCLRMKVFKPENNSILTKKELCNDIDVAKRCYTQFLNSLCSGNKDVLKWKEDFFEAATVPCSSSHINISFVTVLFLVVIPTLFNKKIFYF